MRRTELLQEVRQMRFEKAYGSWKRKSLTQEEAANRYLSVFRHYAASFAVRANTFPFRSRPISSHLIPRARIFAISATLTCGALFPQAVRSWLMTAAASSSESWSAQAGICAE